jgi:hypothetical protein
MALSIVIIIIIIQKRKTKSSLNYLNFEFVTQACQANTSAWTVDAANNHCMPKRGPTCQGIDAPRHYQHTIITSS